jgi:cytochrome oxidase Cu insertion factor (SCO1/SenC/PrrC family)
VALTLDPEHDSREVLAAWTDSQGATGWSAARTGDDATRELAMLAGLPVARSANGEIVHQLRWLALDGDGRLVARTDSNDVDAEALLNPLR